MTRNAEGGDMFRHQELADIKAQIEAAMVCGEHRGLHWGRRLRLNELLKLPPSPWLPGVQTDARGPWGGCCGKVAVSHVQAVAADRVAAPQLALFFGGA